jgi:hypothetical protein
MVIAAEQNDLKPNIGRVMDLIVLWSCSQMLFNYLIWRVSISPSWSALQLSMAAVWAPFMSIVIFAGAP